MQKNILILLSLCLFFTVPLLGQEFGKASYYGNQYQGSKTASGELYDANKFTAAHKLHDFGTQLRVTRVDNGASVLVTVNDRGPLIKGRIIDLSYAAAKRLDMIRDGTIDVKVEVVGKAAPETTSTPVTQTPTPDRSTNPSTTNTGSATPSSITTAPINPASSPSTATDTRNSLPVTQNNTNTYQGRLLKKPYAKYGLYEFKILNVNKAGFGVQIASLSSYENAMKQLTQLQTKNINNALISIEPKQFGGMSFKVIVGPYTNRNEAKRQASRINRQLKVKGFVVDLSTIEY